MAQPIPSVLSPAPPPPPPPRHLSGIFYLVGPGGGVRKPLSENGASVNSSRSGWYRSFFNILLKNASLIFVKKFLLPQGDV